MTIRIVNGDLLPAVDDDEAVVELAAAFVVFEDELELEPQAPTASASAPTENNQSAALRARLNEPRIYLSSLRLTLPTTPRLMRDSGTPLPTYCLVYTNGTVNRGQDPARRAMQR
jgi:hypothetical protein